MQSAMIRKHLCCNPLSDMLIYIINALHHIFRIDFLFFQLLHSFSIIHTKLLQQTVQLRDRMCFIHRLDIHIGKTVRSFRIHPALNTKACDHSDRYDNMIGNIPYRILGQYTHPTFRAHSFRLICPFPYFLYIPLFDPLIKR